MLSYVEISVDIMHRIAQAENDLGVLVLTRVCGNEREISIILSIPYFLRTYIIIHANVRGQTLRLWVRNSGYWHNAGLQE